MVRKITHFYLQHTDRISLGEDSKAARLIDNVQMVDQAAEQLSVLCRQYQVFDLVTAYLPVGFWSNNFERLRSHPLLEDMHWHLVMRDFDRRSWPSTAGRSPGPTSTLSRTPLLATSLPSAPST